MAYPPTDPHLRSWLDAGLAAHQRGDFDEALEAYRRILSIAPEHGPALNLLGTALLQLGQPVEALGFLERASRRQRDNPNLLANLGQAYLAVRRFDDAYETFRKATRLAPKEVQHHVGLATSLAMQGKFKEAETMLQRLALRFPDVSLVWFNLGNALRDQRRPDEAIAAYAKALDLDPHDVQSRCSLGSVLHSLQRFPEAEKHYRACLDIDPTYSAARYNLASVIIDLGRFREAEVICREIVAREPDAPEGHTFLGAAVGHQGRLLEAVACHAAAARLAPDNPKTAAIYGAGLMDVGRVPEGRRRLIHAIDAIDATQGDDSARQTLGTSLLAHGYLQDGWTQYAYRPAALRFRAKYPQIDLVDSLPARLGGLSICLLREQGLGDEIFFLRYVPLLAASGAQVTYRASNKLATLLSRVRDLSRVLEATAPFPKSDAYLLIGDVPHAVGASPSSALPAPRQRRRAAVREFAEGIQVYSPLVPPSLRIEPLPEKLAATRQRLAAAGPPPYIGVTWRAGTPPEEQGSVSWMLYKTIDLSGLAAVLKGAGATLVALQRNPGPGEIDALASAVGKPLHDFTAYNDDLEGMLALLEIIDDYVGVSNTNMHLRAAAGKTARVLVPAPGEWRWMRQGRHSPWFPGFSIYRQSLQGDWTAAVATLARDLTLRFPAL